MSAQPLNLYDVDQYTSSKNGAEVAQVGALHTVEYRFVVTDLPENGVANPAITIPVGAVIEGFDLIVESTLTGGTDITVGLIEPDGSAIDPDGLLAASTTATGVIAGAGAKIGTQLAVEAQLLVATSRTGGVAKAVISYSLY